MVFVGLHGLRRFERIRFVLRAWFRKAVVFVDAPYGKLLVALLVVVVIRKMGRHKCSTRKSKPGCNSYSSR